jgi:hypothetical protein
VSTIKRLWPIAVVLAVGGGVAMQWGAMRRYWKLERM